MTVPVANQGGWLQPYALDLVADVTIGLLEEMREHEDDTEVGLLSSPICVVVPTTSV
jgi:hypothetical protein